MTTLKNGDFELDGVVWGTSTRPLMRDTFSMSGADVRDQDAVVPGGHGVRAGRDLLGGAVWSWKILAMAADSSAVLDLARDMASVWRSYLDDPDAMAVLRLKVADRVMRVYGRPRRWLGPDDIGMITRTSAGRIDATFRLTDPLIYDDAEQTLDMSLVAASAGVLVLPEELPWILGRAVGTRSGEITVGGEAAVPFQLTFHGPTSGAAEQVWAEGPGWRVDLGDLVIPWGESVTLDTRTNTLTRSNGQSVAGSARGRFIAARLKPGYQEISWGAVDPTNSARAALVWHSGHYSL